MTKQQANLSLLLLLMIPASLWANPPIETNKYWTCTAEDSSHQQWASTHIYQRTATNNAAADCKKNSKTPRTCAVSKEACEEFVNGRSTRPMWQCTALDQFSKVWRSNTYLHRDDAAIGAKAYCKEHSAMPMSCFVNLLTCKNQNEPENR